MQQDFIHFLLILYLIYLSDCIIFARASEWVVYTCAQGLKRRVKSTDESVVIGRRYWMLRPLFVPLGSSFRLELPRCALGHDGFCSSSPLSNSTHMNAQVRYVAYDEVESIDVRGDTLLVNGEVWFEGAGADLLTIKRGVESVLKKRDRAAAVRRWIRSNYKEGRAFAEQISVVERRTDVLNFMCSIYAIWLLLILPVGMKYFSPVRLLWGIAAPLLLLHCMCAVLFLWAYKRLVSPERGGPWGHFFKMFLCPPMMVRACDVVYDHAVQVSDAVSMLMSVSERSVWAKQVQRIWRRLIPARRLALDPRAAKAMNEFAADYRSVLALELEKYEIDPLSLEVDDSTIPSGERYCPACSTIYRSDVEMCADCGDVPLLNGRG